MTSAELLTVVAGLLLSLATGCRLQFPAEEDPVAESQLSPRDRARRASFQRALAEADDEVDQRFEADGEHHKQVEQRLRAPRNLRVQQVGDYD